MGLSRPVGIITFLVLLRSAERLLWSTTASPEAALRITATPLMMSHTAQDAHGTPAPVMLPPAAPTQEPATVSREASTATPHANEICTACTMRPLHPDEAAFLWKPIFSRMPTQTATLPRQLLMPLGCRDGCGDHGICNEHLGTCQCSSGWSGPHCQLRRHWQCNAADGKYLWSRCSGHCDTRFGYCLCGPRSTYPERPLLQCEPRGIEKARADLRKCDSY